MTRPAVKANEAVCYEVSLYVDARKKLGTRKQLAERLGITMSLLDYIERNDCVLKTHGRKFK